MLILGDVSGIQSYIFDVAHDGGGQAKRLRARSFYIQLLAECFAFRILKSTGWPADPDPFLINGAGKFLLQGPSLAEKQFEQVQQEYQSISQWLMTAFNGQIRLSLATLHVESKNPVLDFSQIQSALQQEKYRPWSIVGITTQKWNPSRLVLAPIDTPCAVCKRRTAEIDEATDSGTRKVCHQCHKDVEIGRALSDLQWISLSDIPEANSLEVARWCVRLVKRNEPLPNQNDYLLSIPPIPKALEKIPQFRRRLAHHVPKQNNELVRFSDLALGGEGDNLLAVLKADVDSLGSHFKNLLATEQSFFSLKKTSQELDQFFAGCLDNELHQPQWSRIYTIFAGGDDLLLVGRWDLILDYAQRVHKLFHEQFGNRSLTLSAGIAFAKPKQPIKFAVEQAEELLHQAKTRTFFGDSPKDQLATLGQVWKWSNHQQILECGKQWKTWVNQGIAQRGWLQTLLKLGLQREGSGEDKWMATAHLAYHVARNYDDRTPEKRRLRHWANQLIQDFDDQTSIESRYLPAIARYVLMATRRVQEED